MAGWSAAQFSVVTPWAALSSAPPPHLDDGARQGHRGQRPLAEEEHLQVRATRLHACMCMVCPLSSPTDRKGTVAGRVAPQPKSG